MPDKRYTKVEEEVIQILDRLESEKPSTSTRPNLRLVESPRPRKQPSRLKSVRPSFNLWRMITGKPWIWIAAAIGLAFAALVVRDTSDNLALALALASIIAFFAPLFVNRRGSSGRGSTGPGGEIKTWRGRDISFDPPGGPSPSERVSRWIQDRKHRGPRL
jgi:hypothetical protein